MSEDLPMRSTAAPPKPPNTRSPAGSRPRPAPRAKPDSGERAPPPPQPTICDLAEAAWHRTCFYSSPIGEPDSRERRHSDALLKFLIKPALAALDPSMRVIRADQLASSLITAGVFEHVEKSRLMIADLSFHNPNVFHEIGRRQQTGKPYVLISRTDDPIPSNVRDVRTVRFSSEMHIYLNEMEQYKEQIEQYARWALATAEGIEGQ